LHFQFTTSEVLFTSKQSNGGYVSNQINKPISLDFEGFTSLITKGLIFCPALLKGARNDKNWIAQQAFATDFDSGYQSALAIDRAKECGITPNMMYHRYSD
jgi:hypothetical protein